jgi:hypothetical protein
VPHSLISDAPREIARQELTIFNSGQNVGQNVSQSLSGVPGPSSLGDIVWWAFVLAVFASLIYIAVRRKQV